MILVSAPLTYRYKKYSFLLPTDIHFQYPFLTRCRFYLHISTGTNCFDIPNHIKDSLNLKDHMPIFNLIIPFRHGGDKFRYPIPILTKKNSSSSPPGNEYNLVPLPVHVFLLLQY